jgi:hypothetical protein
MPDSQPIRQVALNKCEELESTCLAAETVKFEVISIVRQLFGKIEMLEADAQQWGAIATGQKSILNGLEAENKQISDLHVRTSRTPKRLPDQQKLSAGKLQQLQLRFRKLHTKTRH